MFANVLLLTSSDRADRIAEQTSAEVNHREAGATRLPNGAGLVYKVLGMETETVRERVRQF